MADLRINARSPYYIDSAITVVEETEPDPIEENTPPTVTITASDPSPYEGQTITLTAVATDSDGTVVSYEWSTTETTTAIDVTRDSEGCEDYYVTVTDDDGDTGVASIRICWQAEPEPIEDQPIGINCGDTIEQGPFVGQKVYNLLDIGTKVGDITVSLNQPSYGLYDIPVKFDIKWGTTTETTNYVGSSHYDGDLIDAGVNGADIDTTFPTNKTATTSVTLSKTTETPDKAQIIVTSPLMNDNYSFTVTCPTACDTNTYFYNLFADGETTLFSYTDENGASQNISVDDGDTVLITAEEDSVSVVDGTGTITKGGKDCQGQPQELTINQNVEFAFWIDDSGSLDHEKEAVVDAMNNQLADTMLKFYNNDRVLYDKRFYHTLNADERPFTWPTNVKRDSSSEKIVNIIMNDATRYFYYYHYSFESNPINRFQRKTSPSFATDMASFRSGLESASFFGEFTTIFIYFDKSGDKTDIEAFHNNYVFPYIATSTSTPARVVGGFTGNEGLGDKPEVIFIKLQPNQSSQYYHDEIVSALRSLGYKI